MKKMISVLALLGMFLVPFEAFATGGYTPDFGGEPYTTDLTSCYTYYNSGIYECAAGTYVLTAWTGSNNPCAATSVVPAIPSSTTVSTTANATATGGFYYNCLGDDETTYANWECLPKTDNINNHVATTCTTPAGTSISATISDGSATNCLSGWTNCSGGNDGFCEIQIGSAYPGAASAVYTSTCTAVCASGYLSCTELTENAADDADGCEDVIGVSAPGPYPNTVYGSSCSSLTCASGYFLLTFSGTIDTITVEGCEGEINEDCTTLDLLPGTCTGDGETGTVNSSAGGATCACSILDVPEFATGGFVDSDGIYEASPAIFSTLNPLLWGQQNNAGGSFMEFLDGTGTAKFAVDILGTITAGFIGDANLGDVSTVEGKVLGVLGGVIDWIDAAAGSATSLDGAYNTGNTIDVDGLPILITGTHDSNNIFQLVQDDPTRTGTVLDISNTGMGDSIIVTDGVEESLVVDAEGTTTLKQLQLISADTNGVDGKPNVTCDAVAVGNIAYVTEGFIGNYFGCKQTTETTYEWVSLSIFGN